MSNYSYGIQNEAAPEWSVAQWFNLPEGKTSLDLADYKDKVVYLYCFQSWCPGCHSHGFPTLKVMQELYAGDDRVAFVAIQTVFEGFETNTLAAAKQTAVKHDLQIPFGHDAPNGTRSKVMQSYRSGGTPWTVLIDTNGVVRFNDFQAQPAGLIDEIDRMLE